jgi:hypothetical protein
MRRHFLIEREDSEEHSQPRSNTERAGSALAAPTGAAFEVRRLT